MNKNFIYFDHASTSPLSKDVLDTINYSFENYWGNVSSTYKSVSYTHLTLPTKVEV